MWRYSSERGTPPVDRFQNSINFHFEYRFLKGCDKTCYYYYNHYYSVRSIALFFFNAFVFPSLTKGKRVGDTFANGNGENY